MKLRCPKCAGEIEMGHLPGAFSWSVGKNLWKIKRSERIFGYTCENCGYVEFYLELKEKKRRIENK